MPATVRRASVRQRAARTGRDAGTLASSPNSTPLEPDHDHAARAVVLDRCIGRTGIRLDRTDVRRVDEVDVLVLDAVDDDVRLARAHAAHLEVAVRGVDLRVEPRTLHPEPVHHAQQVAGLHDVLVLDLLLVEEAAAAGPVAAAALELGIARALRDDANGVEADDARERDADVRRPAAAQLRRRLAEQVADMACLDELAAGRLAG